MSKRLCFSLLALCALVTLWINGSAAFAQQDDSKKQTLVINYPNSGVILKGTGTDVVRYRGLIYVKVFPISPDLVKRYGAGPIATAELSASQRDLRLLPLGEYEVRFGMRTGSELKTYIVRDVILRADRATSLLVEMNDAKTTIIGGDMTAQEIADSIRHLRQEVADLKKEIAALKLK